MGDHEQVFKIRRASPLQDFEHPDGVVDWTSYFRVQVVCWWVCVAKKRSQYQLELTSESSGTKNIPWRFSVPDAHSHG